MTKDILEDIRIEGYNALLTPQYVKEEFPVVCYVIKEIYKYKYLRILV